MVDVSAKSPGVRTARARATVVLPEGVLDQVMQGQTAKGDALAVARVAGVMAVKKTSELIPLCHPLSLDSVTIDFSAVAGDGTAAGLEVTVEVRTTDKTGVEMEAMVGASVVALTIYDMCKAADKSITIREVQLLEKTGGKSGPYRRAP